MGEQDAVATAATLLSCAAVSLVTSLAVHLYFHAAATHQDAIDVRRSHNTVDVHDDDKRIGAAAASAQADRSFAVAEAQPSLLARLVVATTETSEATAPLAAATVGSAPIPIVDLQSLPADQVPEALRLDAFVSREHQDAFEHAGVFANCSNVFAVLDAIHPYVTKFFETTEWMQTSVANAHITILKSSSKRDADGRCLADSDGNESSDDDDDNDVARLSPCALRRSSSYRRERSHWRLPECIDPDDNTEILLYPGVNPLTFAPDKVINLPPRGSTSGGPRKLSAIPSRLHSPTNRRYSFARASEPDDADDAQPPKKNIVVLPGALVLGGTFDVSDGSVYIGRNVRIEPNVFIKGPTIIGDGSTVRSGAYIRGDVIIGHGVVLRGELKNALVLDRAELCHPGYCGDSICGVRSHFGNQVTTANLNLFASNSRANLMIDVDGTRFDTGRRKVGVVLGDHSQLGCSTVTDPCTLLLPNTVAYPLARLRKGVYGPNQVIKNKPMERGVLEIAPLRPISEQA